MELPDCHPEHKPRDQRVLATTGDSSAMVGMTTRRVPTEVEDLGGAGQHLLNPTPHFRAIDLVLITKQLLQVHFLSVYHEVVNYQRSTGSTHQ